MTKRGLVGMLLIGFLFVLVSACDAKGIPHAKNWEVEDFTYLDQEGKRFSKEDVDGKVWIANFIFTSCNDVCLPMTFNMSKLQAMLQEEGIENVELVSFSVDPEVDKPEVLKSYAEQFKVKFTNWRFLTGYQQKEIERFALNNFKTLVVKADNEDQVTHGTDFYLVDQDGKVVQYYTGLADIPFDDMIQHIKILQKNDE